MAKITSCAFQDGIVYFGNKKGIVFQAIYPD